KLAIEVRGIDLLKRAAIALLPMTDQIRVETACPSNAALEERKLQRREAARNAAQEQPLGNRFARDREMSDVVIHEVGRRGTKARASRPGVEGRHHTQL